MNVEENWNLQAHNLTLVIDYCNLSVWRFTSYLSTSPSSDITSFQIWSKRVACMHSFSNLLHPFSHLSVSYSNTEQARLFLTRSSPLSLYQSIHYHSKTIYLCWHYLTDAVRSVHWTSPHHKLRNVSRLRTAIQFKFYQNVFNDQTNFLIWFFSILDRPLVKHLVIFVAY